MFKKLKAVFMAVILLVLLNFNFSLNSVYANTTPYLRVLTDNAYLYSDQNLERKIFKIPYGYFVKAENIGSEFVRVTYGNDDGEYPVIMGYMNPAELTAINFEPTKPYAVIKVSTSSADILFNDYELKKAYFNVPEDTFMYYYGEFFTENGNLAYVYCKNKLGYIDASCLNPFVIPESPDEIVTITPSPESKPNTNIDNNETSNGLGENLQIIIIVGISVISVSVVYFLFKPAKSKETELEQDDE